MRKLLAATLLVPVLALAQGAAAPGPASPEPSPAEPGSPAASPPRPAPLRAGVPVAPSAPGARGPAAPRAGVPAPAPAMPGALTGSGAASPGQPAAARAPMAPPPAAPRPPAAARAGAAPAEAQLPPGQAGGTARAEGTCQPLQGKFLLAFNKADIVDILEQASRWTCRNFAYTDEVVRGKITLLSKTSVSADEAYAAFLAALTANGIAMYQTGRYWKLVRIADSKKVPIPTLVGDEADYAAVEQPITRVFRLRFLDPDQLRAVLGNFTSPQGADIQTVQPDVLIVTDISLNVRRIEKLLEALDRPGSNDLVRVIQVQYAPARDIADKVNQIFTQAAGGAPGRPGSKRQLIGGVASPGQPVGVAAPGQPVGAAAPAPAPTVVGGGDPSEISISKVVADERTNKLIVISDEKSYQRILELVKQLDTPTAGDGTIHVIYLKNANAEDLANTLQSLTTGGSRRTGSAPGAALPVTPPGTPAPPGQAAPRGPASAELFSGDVKITADKPSNSLVVVASASDFAVVQRLIEKLDRPRRQVFVEAVLMEINVSDDTKVGVGMHYAIPVNTAQGKGFIPLGLEPGRVNSLNPGSALQLGGFLTGLVGPVSAELKDIFPFPSMAVFIQAIQSNSDVNILSTPHLLAQDNEESEIVVGQNVPFQAGYNPGFSPGLGTTGTTGTTTNNLLASPYAVSLIAPIQRQNVDLKLKIKPQIHEGDMIRLDIDEQAEEIVARDPQLGPTTAKRSVKTKVVAKDQTTIVIGGLIQDRNVTAVQKVPLLGDIPLLGWLFRDTVTSKQKTNLLLFLTPYIVRDQADFRRILERKQREQREFYEQYYGKKMGITMAEATPRPGPLSRVRREVQAETAKIDNGGPGGPGERTLGPASAPAPAAWQEPAPTRTPSSPRADPPSGGPPPGQAAPAPGAE